MEDVSTLVARQYEAFAYPQPFDDIEQYVASGSFFLGEPSLFAPALWPHGRPAGPLRILVAGCGTTQAAYTAYMNRGDELVGVDLSETSLAHERFLQERHGLDNLKLFQGDLLEIGELGIGFDLIICSGVLHHMADPVAGLSALRDVLEPDGVMSLMVYGQTPRVGVYMLQDAFRRLAIPQSSEGAAQVRSVIAELPSTHSARYYVEYTPELQHDTALIDTFLHPQDRAYTVPEVFNLLESAGLEFQNWVDNAQYWRNGLWSANSAIGKLVEPLADRDHWAVVEMLRQGAGMHAFTARHQAKSRATGVDFANGRWSQFMPHRTPGLVRVGRGEYRRGLSVLRCSPVEEFILESVDGRRTIEGIFAVPELSRIPVEQREASGRAFFEHLWKLGHVMITLPE